MMLFVLQYVKVPDAVTVAEQSHLMVDGVDDQIGKVLLFISSPRVTASILVLQRRNNTICDQHLC